MKLHFIEGFYSIQGEGMRVGCPSVFLRMFGCNFRCRSFGMPVGKTSDEYLRIDPSNYTNINDLPLVRSGCDSYISWDVRCKHLVKKEEPLDLARILTQLTPNNNWNGIDLVITGGEPLLGWQKIYPELLDLLSIRGLTNVTFETNTTQELHPLLREFIKNFNGEVTFSCSPKLSISGEQKEDAICPEIAKIYSNIATGGMYFKFVVDPRQDMSEVEDVIKLYNSAGVNVPVYLMPVGGCLAEYKANVKKVAKIALNKGWRYSPRLQVDLFGNDWST